VKKPLTLIKHGLIKKIRIETYSVRDICHIDGFGKDY
jgi:hypothetical protein